MDSYFAARYLEDKRKLFSIGCFYNDKNGVTKVAAPATIDVKIT